MKVPTFTASETLLAARTTQILVQANRLAYAEIAPNLTLRQTSPNFWTLCSREPRRGHIPLSYVLDEFVGAESALIAVLMGKLPEYTLEFVNRQKPDGNISYLTFRVTSLDKTSPERGLLLLVEDVTELGQLIQQVAQERNTLHFVQTELERANTELEKLSFTDSLTGLGNRYRLDFELARELNRSARLGHPLTLLLLDLDNLQVLRETYGHPLGDQILRRLGAWLQTYVRGMDLVARWGDNTFAILLPETGTDSACRVAERLAAMPTLAPPSREDNWDADDTTIFHRLTISIGGAVAPAGLVIEPATLVQAANNALSQAKCEGQNRWVIVDAKADTSPKV